MTWWICVLFWTCLRQQAGDIPQFVQWRDADLKQLQAAMAPKINAQKYYVQQLANYGNHSVMLMYREGSGEAASRNAGRRLRDRVR